MDEGEVRELVEQAAEEFATDRGGLRDAAAVLAALVGVGEDTSTLIGNAPPSAKKTPPPLGA